MTTKEYYARNRERLLAEAKEKYRANLEVSRTKGRDYQKRKRQANPEKARAKSQAYYAKNRDKVLAVSKKWWASHPGADAAYHRKDRVEKPHKHLFVRAKERAKLKGLPFNITKDDIVVPEFCPVLGIRLVVGDGVKSGMRDASPSLDRIIPELGYVKGNICVISWRANSIKRNASYEELIKIAEYVKRETDGKA